MNIEITLSLWGKERKVVVSPLMGGNYHLYIDSRFHGMFLKRQGKYEFVYIVGCDLPADELHGLLDVLEEAEKSP